MNERSHSLLKIRPEIGTAKITDNMSSEEYFQNKTLRQVLNMQNTLLLHVFKNYIAKHKDKFYTLSLEKRFEYIENAIQRDIKFRNSLKGIVIGLFTVEEYDLYTQNSSALNKRMMKMVVERLKDQIQAFEKEEIALV
ncbi:glyoxalase [Cellulophaga baltica]|uniref:glyoxalase n=1 Tax=Cellulophaga TaxID=104264 RepID=UPI001C07CB41|nr:MULTISPECIES: glyoxalase [Cellulophaga]MBU2996227.1 glyoxalase [Cellulophaga baltica]MDO6767622.1 glyoxalase [Cellulophaga sp. 1_MG-2023]